MDVRVLELFSGAGVFSLGFKMEKFKILLAIESLPKIAETYIKNFSDTVVLIKNIRRVTGKEIVDSVGEIDVVIGGPPCTAYSARNPKRKKNARDRLLKDPLGSLVLEFFRIVKSTSWDALQNFRKDLLNSEFPKIPKKYIAQVENMRFGDSLVTFRGADGIKRNWIKINPEKPAPPVTATSRFIHPYEARGLSVREHTLLMSFPNSFIFYCVVTIISSAVISMVCSVCATMNFFLSLRMGK